MNPLIKYPVLFVSKIINGGKSVYKDDFNSCAETYDDVITRPLLAQATEKLLKSYGPLNGDRSIDCGCGTGHSTEIIAQMTGARGSVFGCDFSENMINIAKKRLKDYENATFQSGDMIEILNDSEKVDFDFAGIFWALEYVNHSVFFKKLNSTMKKGARVSVLVNHRLSLIELQDMITPIVLKNIISLKKIPPLNFISGMKEFEKAAKKGGFKTDHIVEEKVSVHFSNGADLIKWMLQGGPSAGFKSSIREKKRDKIFNLIAQEVDRRNGLSVTFKYISYSGIKE